MIEGTGQPLYPAIQFEDGGRYREESQEMVRTIRESRLIEKELGSVPAASGSCAQGRLLPGGGRPKVGVLAALRRAYTAARLVSTLAEGARFALAAADA